MRDAAFRWTFFIVALFALGPVAYWLTANLRAPDGFTQVEPILAQTGAATGVLRGCGAILLSAVVLALTARFISMRWAFLCAGATLAWGAAGAGRIDELLRLTPDRALLWQVALEGAIFAALLVACVRGASWWVARLPVQGAGTPAAISAPGDSFWRTRLDSVPPGHRDTHAPIEESSERWMRVGASIAIAVSAGMAVAWFVALSTLKGQTLAAAVIGAVATGIITGMLHKQAPAWVLLAGFAVLAVAAPALGALTLPRDPAALLTMVNAGPMAPPARVVPLDWLAGALIGLPIGSKWGVGLVTAERA
ncbi:hypothetical protein BH11PLA1_BH11PLA1_19820 [soil metagenome]